METFFGKVPPPTTPETVWLSPRFWAPFQRPRTVRDVGTLSAVEHTGVPGFSTTRIREGQPVITSTSHRRQPAAETNPDLLARLRHGDRAAFGELHRQTVAVLTRYVAARLRDRDRGAVDDPVQEAYCTALAEPHLLGEDLLGSMLRLAARAVVRSARTSGATCAPPTPSTKTAPATPSRPR